jgi:hypothetical protein
MDAGASWRPVNAGLTATSISALAIDPAAPAAIYAGTAGGGVFSILQVPVVSPRFGLSSGGTTVTISGLTFTLVSGVAVTFGGVAATNTTIINATTLSAVAGPHGAGTVDVVITNPNHESVTLPNSFVYADFASEVYLPTTFR